MEMKNPLEGGLSYDAKTQAVQNKQIQDQTAGGSMYGMPAAAQAAMQANPNAEMPTAKEVATDNKIYNQVGEDRKPLWKPPVQTPTAGLATKQAAPAAAPEAPANPESTEAPVNPDEINPEALNDLAGIKQEEEDNSLYSQEELAKLKSEFEGTKLDKEDVEAIASQGAVIDKLEGSDDKKSQQDVVGKYVGQANDLQKKAESKWQLWATIASMAVYVFSGGIIPPVNFMKLTGQTEAKKAWLDIQKQAAENELLPKSSVAGMQEAGKQTKEDKTDFETGVRASSDIEAAKQGAQTVKELDWKYLKDIKGIDQKNAKELMTLKDDLDTKSQIKILQAAHGFTMEEKEQAYGFLVDEMKDKMESVGITPTVDHLIDYSRALMGESAWTKNASLATNILGTAGGIALRSAGL